jgi:hypothetical protein
MSKESAMPAMNSTRTMRDKPNGAPIGATADLGMNVAILEAADGWSKIKLVDDVQQPTGWVSTDAVGTDESTHEIIDKAAFARACWRTASACDVNAHYLAAVAEHRSRIRDGEESGKIGPYRLTPVEWEANRKSGKFGFEFKAADIADWRVQCIVFGSMVNAALAAVNTPPKVIDLYLKQFPPAAPLSAADRTQLSNELKSAIESTRSLIVEAGGEVLDDEPDKVDGVLSDAGTKTKTTPKGSSGKLFEEKAPAIMGQLIADFGLDKKQAAGILGNIGHECAGFTLMQEQSPIGGGRGGFGWCQWTGPRRVNFERFCSQQGMQPTSDKANYGFLKLELNSTERAAITAVKATSTVKDAVRKFELNFERAGIKHYESRDRWAERALTAFAGKST